MNLFDLVERFPSHESCIEHLENVRWGNSPVCPHCESERVARKREGNKIGRWNCYLCKSSFNVLSGTLFQGTKIPLPKWFLAIALIGNNATKSMSSVQLARHLGLNQGSTWSMMQRIQTEMATKKKEGFLQRIIRTDEIYVGGKPCRRTNNNGESAPPSKRQRDTKKTPIVNPTEHDAQLSLFVFD